MMETRWEMYNQDTERGGSFIYKSESLGLSCKFLNKMLQ